MRTIYSTLLIILSSLTSVAQDSSASDLTTGKWTICWNMKLFKDCKCDTNAYAIMEFDKNGTYKENRQLNNSDKNPQVPPQIRGKWTLVNNSLMIDENDTPRIKVPARTENIVWLNKDTFYTQGQEGPGGPIVYTYYHRK